MMKTRSDRIAYLFILPNYLIYLIFIFIPVLSVVYLGFTDYSFIDPPRFIGLKNYVTLFHDSIFLQAIKNTVIYWIGTVAISMALGLALAVMLSKPRKGVSVFRAAFYLPNVLSLVAVALMWLWLYDPAKGIFNMILLALGLPLSDWLYDPNIALFLVMIPGIWTMLGFNMVIYLAGLQAISPEYYEVARIEGASVLQQFRLITLPLLKPITFFIFVMASIKSFQVFDQIYVMTGGGPVNATTTITFEIYQNGFYFYKMGYASAMSVVLLLIVGTLTILNFSYGKEGYEGV
ncbi:MAG: sugar ABC transporter permease [bacterium]|nr:sugar ABC transporter permease [bacterium]